MPVQNEVSLRITAEDDASQVLVGAVRQLGKLQREVDDTAKSFTAIDKSTDTLDSSLKDITRTTGTYRDASGRLRNELGRFVREARTAQNTTLDFSFALESVARNLRSVGDFGARQLRTFVQSGIRLEQLESAFTSLFGSIDEARSAIAQLRIASQDPGLTFDVAARGAQRFSSLGLSIQESIHLMRGLANAASLSGTNLAQLDEGARQLFQAISRGKLEQEDLNSLTERFGTIARQVRQEYGKTAEDINNALQSQGKSIRDFALEITSLANAPRASANTLANAISNLNNAIEEVRAEIGTDLIPVVKDLTEFLTDLVRAWQSLDDRQQRMIIDLGILTTALSLLGSTVLTVAANIGVLNLAFGATGTGLIARVGAAAASISVLGVSLGTLGIGVAGVGALTGAFFGLREELREQDAIAQAAGSRIEIIGTSADETEDFVIDLSKAVELAGGSFDEFAESVGKANDAVGMLLNQQEGAPHYPHCATPVNCASPHRSPTP